jgi:hypothetical protein
LEKGVRNLTTNTAAIIIHNRPYKGKNNEKDSDALILLQLIGCTQQPAINTHTNEKEINELKAEIKSLRSQMAVPRLDTATCTRLILCGMAAYYGESIVMLCLGNAVAGVGLLLHDLYSARLISCRAV